MLTSARKLKDGARIDELLSKADEFLSMQKAAITEEKQLKDYKKKREGEEDHTRDKDDFDGTPQSLKSSLPQPGGAPAQEEDAETKSKSG